MKPMKPLKSSRYKYLYNNIIDLSYLKRLLSQFVQIKAYYYDKLKDYQW